MFNKDLTAIDLHKVQKALANVAARALTDENFRRDLINDPIRIFEDNGVYFSAGRRVEVLQNTDDIYYFILPNSPEGIEQSDVQSYTSMIGEGGNSSLDTGGPRCTKP